VGPARAAKGCGCGQARVASMGSLLLRHSRSDSSTERDSLGMRAHSTTRAPRVKQKNVTKMTHYAFFDNVVQRRYFLAIFQVCALNTQGHLQGAATDGNREAQRPIASLTGL
jgi:hypothetical protein